MIKPTEKDIGRGVVYRNRYNQETEDGVITSFNDRFVFVRYKGQLPSNGKATFREDLTWLKEGEAIVGKFGGGRKNEV